MAILFARCDIADRFSTIDEISKTIPVTAKRSFISLMLCAKRFGMYPPRDIRRMIAILCSELVVTDIFDDLRNEVNDEESLCDGSIIVNYYKFYMSHKNTQRFNPFIYNQIQDNGMGGLLLLTAFRSPAIGGVTYNHPLSHMLKGDRSTSLFCVRHPILYCELGKYYYVDCIRYGDFIVGIVEDTKITKCVSVPDRKGKIYEVDTTLYLPVKAFELDGSNYSHDSKISQIDKNEVQNAKRVWPLNEILFYRNSEVFCRLEISAHTNLEYVDVVYLIVSQKWFKYNTYKKDIRLRSREDD